MKEQIISEITRQMLPYLDNAQLEHLLETLQHCLWSVEVIEKPEGAVQRNTETNEELLTMFLSAKRVEGCSEKTLHYYETSLQKMFSQVDSHVTHMTTDALRNYLSEYQQKSQCSKSNIDNIRRILSSFFAWLEDENYIMKSPVRRIHKIRSSKTVKETYCSKSNIDNIRRILSSFFAWLEDENYIMKSPVRRIHKIRSSKTVKETYTDEALETMRDQCGSVRDLAMIDLLASTGMRVGELVHLNREDIDFENRECVVFGKGSKERPVYFDARTKIHLKNYLDSRKDDNPALFVSLLSPHNRLEISGVELCLRKLGRRLGITKVHPHKFRRTLATRAIDKGMPIEQVQRLLGHAKIDTTMQYAMVNQNNVKISHRK